MLRTLQKTWGEAHELYRDKSIEIVHIEVRRGLSRSADRQFGTS